MQQNVIKSAMHNGLIMGVLFSINFLLSIQKNSLSILLSYFVMAAIIILSYRTTLQYRDGECNGEISFRHAMSFILFTFFFAGMISSLVKYIYFQYVNTQALTMLMTESLKQMETLNLDIQTKDAAKFTSTKPASFAIQYIWVNVIAGLFIGSIMALFIKKEIVTKAENE